MKRVSIQEASYFLDTSSSSIMVTVCVHKKKHGVLPHWYSDKLVDIDYLTDVRNKELEYYRVSSNDIYYYLIDEMGLKDTNIAKIMADKSEIYNKFESWRSFMHSNLFSEPRFKFIERVSRMSEFYRIGMDIKKEHIEKLNSTK